MNKNPFYYSIGTRVRDPIFAKMFGPVKDFLDVGCGLGYFTDYFAKKGATSTGIDLDERCLEYCNREMQGDYIHWDLTSFPYPFPDGSFDAVLCSEVLEHIQDNGRVVDEIYRLLKPGGVFVASVPCKEGIFGAFFKNIGHSQVDDNSLEYHYHKGFDRNSLTRLLTDHGITVTEIQYTMVAAVEVFMGLTKIFVGKRQAKNIDSQADALNMTKGGVWGLYRRMFPVLLAVGAVEQPLGKWLRGHMIIAKGVKK